MIALRALALLLLASTLAAQHPGPSSADSSRRILAWAVNDSMVVIARGSPTATFFRDPDGVIEVRSAAGGPWRRIADSLPPVAELAISRDGRQLAAAVFSDQVVTMRYRRSYVGGLRFYDLSTGKQDTTAHVEPDEPALGIAYTTDGRFLLSAHYEALPPSRDCPYVQCGEDETTRHIVRLHRLNLRTGADTKLYVLGRDNMDDSAVHYRMSPRGDRVLAWYDSTRAWMIDLRTVTRVRGFRRDALRIDGSKLMLSCAPEDGGTGFVGFSDDGALIGVATEHALRIVSAATGETLFAPKLADSTEMVRSVGKELQGDSTQTVVLGGRVLADSSVVLVTCRPGIAGSRVERLDSRTGVRRILMTTDDLLRDAILLPGRVVARTEDDVLEAVLPSKR